MCLAWWSHCNAVYVFLKKLCFVKECIKIVKPCCTLFSLVFGMRLPEQKGQGRQRQSVVAEYPHLHCSQEALWAARGAARSQPFLGRLCQEVQSGSPWCKPTAALLADEPTNKMNLASVCNPAIITRPCVIKFPTSRFPLEILAKWRLAWVR